MSAGYQYGSAYVQHCRTLQFEWNQERDPTGTDAMYSKYTIRVKGFIATSDGSFPGVGDSKNTAVTINLLKAILETPRQSMRYSIGDTTLVQILPGDIDAKLGPAPMEARVTEATGGTFMVECGCVVYKVDCDNVCPNGRSSIVSLRWTQTESFDENWNAVLTTNGKLIVRSDLLESADNHRALCTPPLLKDYVRTVSKYTLSPNGLELDFTFEDHEKDRLPPFPATKAMGSYTVTTARPGFKREGTVRLRLEGPKGTSRKALLIRAVSMAYSKFEADKYLDPKVPVVWGRFTEDLFDPVIEIDMTAMMSNICRGDYFNGKTSLSTGQSVDVALTTTGAVAATLAFGGPVGLVAAPFVAVGAAGVQINQLTALNQNITSTAANIVGGAGFGIGVVARGGDLTDIASEAFVASVMPSVGQDTAGLGSGKAGIAPPTRKRLAALLTAMFRDPCLCLEPAKADMELRNSKKPGTYERNPDMVDTTELKTEPSVESTAEAGVLEGVTGALVGAGAAGGGGGTGGGGSAGTVSLIEIGETSILAGTSAALGWLRDNAPYDMYEIETTTNWDTGNVQMPGTGTGATSNQSAVVKAHGGMMQVTTAWVAGRTGKPPQLPSFLSPDPNVVPLKGSIVAKEVVTNPDGASLSYMVAGYYVHAVKNPNTYQLQAAVPPMYADPVRQGAAEAVGYWTDIATWDAANGVQGGLALTTNANPFVEGGTDTNIPPVTPAPFRTSARGGQQLGVSGQNGNYIYPTPPVRP